MRQLRGNFQTYALVVAMIVIWILFSALTGGTYLSAQNFSNLFRQMTITAILSVGMVLVIVTGDIDLSVGKLAGYVSVWAAFLQLRVWNRYFPARRSWRPSFPPSSGSGSARYTASSRDTSSPTCAFPPSS